MRLQPPHSAPLAAATLFALAACAQQFSDATIAQVKANLAGIATQSWEIGTRAQALLELDAPSFSVLTPGSIPPPAANRGQLSDVIAIASSVVSGLPTSATPRPLVVDSAAGDPPSIGGAVLLANYTGASGANYALAATDQLEYMLNVVPHASDGAISHRADQVQLWADFVAMTPPFIAYYGALTGNQTLLQLAYTQCSLYRNNLNDNTNMWRHIVLGNGTDPGHWSTGNGWAAWGMLRVLGTIAHSQFAGSMSGQQKDLGNWVSEILDGMYAHLNTTTNLFPNYADQTTFGDGASTALLAAATYRLALLRNVWQHLPQAETVRKALAARVDSDGWLAPVVNPEDFSVQGSHSPEAQAFVLVLHASWRDWVAGGSVGANAARLRYALPGIPAVGGAAAVVLLAMAL